jgi:hypothetical protein
MPDGAVRRHAVSQELRNVGAQGYLLKNIRARLDARNVTRIGAGEV